VGILWCIAAVDVVLEGSSEAYGVKNGLTGFSLMSVTPEPRGSRLSSGGVASMLVALELKGRACTGFVVGAIVRSKKTECE
jgi:hypothetical protein